MHKSSFDELVARFNDPKRNEWQKPEALLDKWAFQEHEVIADIGAGTGYFTYPIAERVGKAIAIDIDQRFLDYIQDHNPELNVETRLCDEKGPALDLHEVDRAIMVNTAHHLQKRGKYFNKVRKGLKVGGEFIIVDFKKGKLPVGPPDDIKVSAKEVTRDLALAGFMSVDVDTTFLDFQYILRAR